MKGQKQVHGSIATGGKDTWKSPIELFNQYDAQFQFTLDAAADETNHLCSRWFGPKGEQEDALTVPWGPTRTAILTNLNGGTQTVDFPTKVWCNPPYSQFKKFIKKASEEAALNHATTVCLLAARTDTLAFHNYIYDTFTGSARPHVQILFLKGRLTFGNPDAILGDKPQPAPFPSMIVIFHAHKVSRIDI